MQTPCRALPAGRGQGESYINLHNYLCVNVHARLISKVFNRVWDSCMPPLRRRYVWKKEFSEKRIFKIFKDRKNDIQPTAVRRKRMDGAKIYTGSGDDIMIGTLEMPEVRQPVSKRFLYRAAKRISDIVISVLGLAVLSAVFVITALAIALEDGGPVFYAQKRIGKDEKEFKIYKFRSMYKNAEAIHENLREEYGCRDVSFKLQNDPRVTKVGRVIRKFNIDELPQLINIIKGDMSLVGPRPLPVYEYVDEQRQYGKRYIKRYAVPQGLTCIWQISNRASVDFEKRMQLDVEYAEKSGLWMDLKLVVKTFVFTVTGRAAY